MIMSKTSKAKFGSKWTAEETALVKDQALTCKQVAEKIGRSAKAVENKRNKLGIKTGLRQQAVASQAGTTVHKDLQVKDEAYWQEQYHALSGKYQKLLKAETLVERLASRVQSLAPTRYSPLPPVARTNRKSSGKPQSAVLMLSDTHIGKNTSPGQTLSFGEYNFSTFMARLKYLEKSIISIVENHVTTKVPELVVAMLGDLLDGTLVHSNESAQLDPVFSQFYCGAHALAQFIRNLAPHFPKVRIYDVVGNHTRFQNQHRMPTKNRYSNFDKFLYALIRELIRDVTNIEWTLDAQPYQLFDVQGFEFFCAHGDTLRGGDKTLGIPNHAVGRLVSTATQLMNKYHRPAPNYYLIGHLHRDIVLPHATGSVLVNGGFPGVDEFGLGEMFTPADPSQKFFFLHPQYGKTATYDIGLKFAEVEPQAPYTVPAEFPMH